MRVDEAGERPQQLAQVRGPDVPVAVLRRRHLVGRAAVGQGVGQAPGTEPVEERVVDLQQHRAAATGETVEHMDLPQRPGPVEPLHHDPRDPGVALVVTAGADGVVVADVKVRAERRILGPARADRWEQLRAQSPPEPRDLAGAAPEQVDDRPGFPRAVRVGFQHGHGTDGHRSRVGLDGEEGDVERAERPVRHVAGPPPVGAVHGRCNA